MIQPFSRVPAQKAAATDLVRAQKENSSQRSLNLQNQARVHKLEGQEKKFLQR